MAIWTPRDWTTGLLVTESIMDAEFQGIYDSFDWDLTWTPAITASSSNPTLSFNLNEGYYQQINKTVFATANIKLNVVTGAGSGDWIISLPVDPRDPGSSYLARIGEAEVYDNSATTGFSCKVIRSGASLCKLRRDGTSQYVTHAAPFAWATNDEINLRLRYRIS